MANYGSLCFRLSPQAAFVGQERGGPMGTPVNSPPDLPYLVYCVFSSAGILPPVPPAGVAEQPVGVLVNGRLGAAVSRASVRIRETGPGIPDLMAYEKVIESIHRERTVLPLQYGCMLPDETRVMEQLQHHQRDYRAALEELAGCVEMGIRIMLAQVERGTDGGGPPAGAPATPGIAYLTNRQRFYAESECSSQLEKALAARCTAAFDGLFIQSKTEFSQDPLAAFLAPILSLYFLVRRECEAGFRQTFRTLNQSEANRMLLSGPWPPFNFVPRWTAA